jgi:hypothetical protein
MPAFFSRIFQRTANPNSSTTLPAHRYDGFTADGRVVLTDRRGASKIPNVDLKSEGLGDDPLAIYKPTGAKQVDAAKSRPAGGLLAPLLSSQGRSCGPVFPVGPPRRHRRCRSGCTPCAGRTTVQGNHPAMGSALNTPAMVL